MAGLYIHIPFCRSKCGYCDFYSSPSLLERWGERYVESILREFDSRIIEIGDNSIDTVYLGGGTPAMLTQHLLYRLCDGIKNRLTYHTVKEWTIEANPEDITVEALDCFKDLGINRISIGVQSFNSNYLKAIGRKHNGEESMRALKLLDKGGWNFSADLMYGLPGQSLEDFEFDIIRLLGYNPPHISAYILTVEPHTYLGHRVKRGEVILPDDNIIEKMYHRLCELTALAGLKHYEIANFARTGYESKHNRAYWQDVAYLGLGAGAHSFDGRTRRINYGDLKRYVETIESGATFYTVDDENDLDRLNDYIFTALRTAEGINEELLHKKYSNYYKTVVTTLSRDNRIDYIDGRYVIRERDWLMSDAIIRDHLVVS